MKTKFLFIALIALSVNSFAQKVNVLSPAEKRDGWKLLFDGNTFNGWIGMNLKTFPVKEKGWIVKDGTITIQKSSGDMDPQSKDLVTVEQFSTFDLRFDFKISEGANSGVKYFIIPEVANGNSGVGLEYQVLDDEHHPDAKLGRDGDRTLASLYDLFPSRKPASAINPIGQWNEGRIVVYPNGKVEHYLNGVKVLEYVRGSKEFRNAVALSKFKNIPNFGEAIQGHILLQDHGFEVNYRNIKIKVLK